VFCRQELPSGEEPGSEELGSGTGSVRRSGHGQEKKDAREIAQGSSGNESGSESGSESGQGSTRHGGGSDSEYVPGSQSGSSVAHESGDETISAPVGGGVSAVSDVEKKRKRKRKLVGEKDEKEKSAKKRRLE
jgi:hypothetical protein